MENITIDKIIAFIRKAIEHNLIVRNFSYDNCFDFQIETKDNRTKAIYFSISPEKINIQTSFYGFSNIKISLSERDKINLSTLALDIDEYQEKIALNVFNNFFDKEEKKPADINDLDNEDD